MIQFINVTKEYRDSNQTKVFDFLNFTLPNKGFISIFGESGSGKTTLLNLLSFLDSPTSGQILYNEKELSQISTIYKNQIVSIIDQDLDLIDDLSVFENVKLGNNIDDLKIDDTLKKLNIFDLKDKKCINISYGERQRVVIARAFVRNVKIIICDELTSALDFENAKIVLESLKELSAYCLVIVSSHNLTIKQYADLEITIQNRNVKFSKEVSSNSENIEINNDNKLNFNQKNKLAFSFLKNNKIFTIFSLILFTFLLYVIFCLISSIDTNLYSALKKYNNYFILETRDEEMTQKINSYSNTYSIYNIQSSFDNIELISPFKPLEKDLKLICGSRPQSKEVLISKAQADEIIEKKIYSDVLNYNDLIGKTITNITFNESNFSDEVSFKISGVETIAYYSYNEEYSPSFIASLYNSLIISNEDYEIYKTKCNSTNKVIIDSSCDLKPILDDYEKFIGSGWYSDGKLNIYAKSFTYEFENFKTTFGAQNIYIISLIICIILFIIIFVALILNLINSNMKNINLLKKLGYKFSDIFSLFFRYTIIFIIIPYLLVLFLFNILPNFVCYLPDYIKINGVKNIMYPNMNNYLEYLTFFVLVMFFVNILYFIASKKKIYIKEKN